MRRHLCRGGVAGTLLALLCLTFQTSGVAQAQSAYKIQPIVTVGDPVVPGGLAPKGSFEIQGLNDNGQLAYVSQAAAANQGDILLQFDLATGQHTPIVVPGATISGSDKWAVGALVRGASLNQQGTIALCADVNTPFNFGTFSWDPKTKALTPVALTGMPAVGGRNFERGGSLFPPSINSSGEIAFGGTVLDSASSPRPGIFFLGRDKKLQGVALPDQPLPSGQEILLAVMPSVNDTGAVAFVVRKLRETVSSAYVWQNGVISPIAVIGADLAGRGKLGDVVRVYTNNKNSNLLLATRQDVATTTSLYLLAGGQMKPVVVRGQDMPGGGRFQTLLADNPHLYRVAGRVVGFNYGVSAANDLGQHAFVARLEDGSTAAYLMDATGILTLITKSGRNTDLGVVKAVNEMKQVAGGYVDSIGVGLNNKGQVALTLAIGDKAPTLVVLTPQ